MPVAPYYLAAWFHNTSHRQSPLLLVFVRIQPIQRRIDNIDTESSILVVTFIATNHLYLKHIKELLIKGIAVDLTKGPTSSGNMGIRIRTLSVDLDRFFSLQEVRIFHNQPDLVDFLLDRPVHQLQFNLLHVHIPILPSGSAEHDLLDLNLVLDFGVGDELDNSFLSLL
jgi:hypothetical protein